MNHIDSLKKLNLPKDKFAIFGSGPLAVREIRDTRDLDIIVKPELWNDLAKKYTLKKHNLIVIGNIEIYRDWLPWFDDANMLIDDADIIGGFRFVKLKYLLEWKKAMNREKDRNDIKLIEQYLKNANAQNHDFIRFKIDTKIFEKFPALNVGVLSCKNIDNKGISDDILSLIRETEKEIRSNFSAGNLTSIQKINVWKDAYRSFGAKPKEHKSSVENLYSRILGGGDIRHINKIVDIYNYISLKYIVPAGGEDLDKIHGDITLTFAGKNEPAVILLGDRDPRAPNEGEVIYKDNISAICRRFNWREADRTKLEEGTKNAVLVIEGLPPTTKDDIEAILIKMKELIQKFCGAEVTISVLNKSNPEMDL